MLATKFSNPSPSTTVKARLGAGPDSSTPSVPQSIKSPGATHSMTAVVPQSVAAARTTVRAEPSVSKPLMLRKVST